MSFNVLFCSLGYSGSLDHYFTCVENSSVRAILRRLVGFILIALQRNMRLQLRPLPLDPTGAIGKTYSFFKILSLFML